MIKVSGLTKTFGNIKAVDDISFDVLEGENLVLLGTSGCGKTTTLKMINRLIDPDAGTISINEVDTSREKPELLRRKIGYVMQNIGLFPHYTVAENIAVVPRLLQWDKKHTINRTLELLKKLHLPENYLQLFPRELSGGQQQRVGLARALISDPDILLMDEPFGALDNVTRSSIQAEFKALEEFTKKTILMVTHDVQEAFELADRICLMDQGKIIQIGTPKELLFAPKNDFVIKFLDGQRLALQFKLVTIEDLWEFLPEDLTHTNKTISADKASMWSVMETFSADRSIEHQSFINTRTKTFKNLNFTQLTNAFNSYQNREIHD
ncbi:ABC transporter ATP-binding protein [Pedobacter sp. JCM 36344]|uniref:ABC transporter ATP-binding protein n=1 Tax=Pedobacter sp. JCM 36344 TaxID=3374280 RepID=UPI00397969F2